MSPSTDAIVIRSRHASLTRKGTLPEVLQCVAGSILCLAVIVVAIVFILKDVFWPDTAFGTTLGVASWQIVNYVLNGLFTVLGVLVASNVFALYVATQRRLLASGRCELAAAALRSPGYVAVYHLSRLRVHPPLIVISGIAALVPAFSAVSVFLVDFKQISLGATIPKVSWDIANTLNITVNAALINSQPESWATLSTLTISSIVAAVNGGPMASCPKSFPCSSQGGRQNIIQFAGNTFAGTSTYGFGAFPQAYWNVTTSVPYDLHGLNPRWDSATTLQVRRTAYAQTSNFTCQSLPFTHTVDWLPSTNLTTLPDGTSTYLIQHTVFTNGPCFARNSSFLIGQYDFLARFDAQACYHGDELQLQFFVLSPYNEQSPDTPGYAYAVQAYGCSSTILEGLTTGVQTSPSSITVTPPPDDGSFRPVPNTTLALYEQWLNNYFDYIATDERTPQTGPYRAQGDWASVFRYNWANPQLGTGFNESLPGTQFAPAYADALVASLGTYLSSSLSGVFDGVFDEGATETHDTVVKQVVRLGAPVAAGVPLLSVLAVLLAAHLALLWLYTQDLLALDTSDVAEMLVRVDARAVDETKVAELRWSEEDGATMSSLSTTPSSVRRRKPVDVRDTDFEMRGKDSEILQGLLSREQ